MAEIVRTDKNKSRPKQYKSTNGLRTIGWGRCTIQTTGPRRLSACINGRLQEGVSPETFRCDKAASSSRRRNKHGSVFTHNRPLKIGSKN